MSQITGKFVGLYKTIGFIVVRGDDNGYDENKSKLLYLFYKGRISNPLGGIMLTRHRVLFESGELDTDFSKLYFFLLSITDRCKEINQHMKYVNIHHFDLNEKEFGDGFQSNLLDFTCDKKKQMTDSVVGVLKKIAKISNTDLVKNANGLWTNRPADSEVEWVDKNRSRIPKNKFKVSY